MNTNLDIPETYGGGCYQRLTLDHTATLLRKAYIAGYLDALKNKKPQ